MGNANESKTVQLTVKTNSKHCQSTEQIIDNLSVNIWVIIQAQHYEKTLTARCAPETNSHGETLTVISEFQPECG